MLQIKEDAVVVGSKYTNTIMSAVQIVFQTEGWLVTVTSGRDSHDTGEHPHNRALDIRFWDVPNARRREIADKIKAILPNYYDVVIETNHYHIEADSKKENALIKCNTEMA